MQQTKRKMPIFAEYSRTSQSVPDHCAEHVHEYAFARLLHAAPFLHGFGSHSLMSTGEKKMYYHNEMMVAGCFKI